MKKTSLISLVISIVFGVGMVIVGSMYQKSATKAAAQVTVASSDQTRSTEQKEEQKSKDKPSEKQEKEKNSTSKVAISESTEVSSETESTEPVVVDTENTEADYAQAMSSVNDLVQNGTVKTGFTMEEYERALADVQALPEGSEKEDLMQKIKLVQQALTNMGVPYNE